MNHDSISLIARIEACELDEHGAADPFSQRLARENAWSELYARLVIREYKRFLALAVIAPHVVTPSEQVDQAWHLHLLYSARYRAFCRQVLGRRLDHGPSSGGQVELEHFTRAYEQTLASYQALFGEAAPEEIWPPVAERFRPGRLARRVDDAEYWVLPKPGFWRWLETRRLLRKLTWPKLACAALAGLAAALGLSSHISGREFLAGYIVVWFLSLIAAYVAKLLARPDAGPENAIPQLEPYDLLQLARGSESAVDGALTALIAERTLAFDEQTTELRVTGTLIDDAADLERRVFREVQESSHPSAAALRAKAPQLTREMGARLEALGLLTSGKERLPFWLALSAPALGLVRIVSRLGTDKPVAGLVVLCVLGVLVARLFAAKVERTPRGNAALDKARLEHREASASELAQAGLIPLSIALFGVAALGLPEASGWTSWLTRTRTTASIDSSGSGCDSGGGGDGCSGGGCGGGCGGCGGCGG